MEPFAAANDVTALRPLPKGITDDQVRAWIAQASTRLRIIGREAGIDIDTIIAADPLLAEVAKDAVVNAVLGVTRNPDALKQFSRSETRGPFTRQESGSYTGTASGIISFDPADLVGLIPETENAAWPVGSARLGIGMMG